jgi:hypothetical protein
MDGVRVDLGIQLNRTVEQLVSTMMNQAQLPIGGNWFPSSMITAHPYDVIYPYAFDNLPEDGLNLLSAIGDLVRARQGKFYFSRSGYWRLQPPRNYAGRGDVDATFTNGVNAMVYEFGRIVNEITVNAYRRRVSAVTTDLLWRSDGTITLDPNEVLEIQARYTSENTDTRVGATDVTLTITADAGVTNAIEPAAGRAKITLTNTTTDAKSVTVLEVRGRRITTFNVSEQVANDPVSIEKYGRIGEAINARVLSGRNWARSIAHYRLADTKDPRGRVRSISFYADDEILHERIAAIGMTDAGQVWWVRVTEDQTNHDGYYAIIGEEHRVDRGLRHTVTWYLEKGKNVATVGDSVFGVVGSSYVGVW